MTVYQTTKKGPIAVEITLKTTVLTTSKNVIEQISKTLRVHEERLLVV